jgi:DNA-binding GntR family transcriptional regulator
LNSNISLALKIYEDIRCQILKRQLIAGDKISERSLREYYQSSRTPIREALKMLELDSWVYALPKKGTFVKGLSMQQIQEIYQVRIALEPMGVLLAVEKLTDQDIKKLTNYLEDMRQDLNKQQIGEFAIKDAYFHLFIAEKSGNKMLANIVQDLTNNIMRLGVEARYSKGRQQDNIEEFEYLVGALQEKKGSEASNWMRQHLMNASKAVLKNMDKKEI